MTFTITLDLNCHLFQMNSKKIVFFLIISILLSNCSFDSKNRSGVWSGAEAERNRVVRLEKEQVEKNINKKIFTSKSRYIEEKFLNSIINLSKPKKNSSWKMSGLNHQNLLGNIYLPNATNRFLKKKVGKNKISISRITASPLMYNNNIFISDDKGTIFNLHKNGELNWKKNIYKKIYKKIYKNLTFSIYKNKLYVADNIGFVYAITIDTGKLIWIKNHGIPIKSKIKILNDKIFLMNQDNRLVSLNISDGSIVWDVRSVTSFIKSQKLLSIAISKNEDIIAITSSGDLINVDSANGNIKWSLNTLGSELADVTDFFKSSDIVIVEDSIILSTTSTMLSYSLFNGFNNWSSNISSVSTPIIDGKNIFFVTEDGFFIIMDLDTGKINSSVNILKIFKKKKKNRIIQGFIMGSGKIYSVTLDGYLIISSAVTGKTESFIKIGSPITSSPIINEGQMYIYTENSRLLGFN